MPFPPLNLPVDLQESLNAFFQRQDFVALYKSYRWQQDTYPNGFPDILSLENSLRTAAMNNRITMQHVISVADWGKLRNIKRVKGPEGTLNVGLYQHNGLPLSQLARDPLPPIVSLQRQVTGLGPTYLSKVIRFSLPEEYGAIDTRIVRVVGRGDPASRQQNWLTLKARNYGYGWYIPKAQATWPNDYAKWLNVLRFFVSRLNDPRNACPCPHPTNFIDRGLRLQGVWTCADVEMAIFSYACQFI